MTFAAFWGPGVRTIILFSVSLTALWGPERGPSSPFGDLDEGFCCFLSPPFGDLSEDLRRPLGTWTRGSVVFTRRPFGGLNEDHRRPLGTWTRGSVVFFRCHLGT